MPVAPSAAAPRPLRTLLIDNFDSFTFNLFHYLAEVNGREPVVVTNDWPEWEPAVLAEFDNVVISPGPGAPDRAADFGICAEVLRIAEIPVLGVCLGFQGMAVGEGGIVGPAPTPVHGRVSSITHDGCDLFAGLPSPLGVVRYHSLAVAEVPAALEVTAQTEDGIVMGLRHRSRPQWGVQFHPESISTERGLEMVRNFARLTREWQDEQGGEAVDAGDRSPESREDCAAGTGEETGAVVREEEHARPDERVRLTFDVRTRDLPMTSESEAIFSAIYADEPYAVWLDGHQPGQESSRFSIMGAPNGPLSRIARANVPAGTVSVTSTAGGETVESGLFDWLNADLSSITITESERVRALPFEFRLGWVGYLGYELKSEAGSPLKHESTHPDAVLMFLDRAIVIDHETNTVHLLALDGGGSGAAGCETWFDAVAARISELSPAEKAAAPVGAECDAQFRQGASAPESDWFAEVLTRHDRAVYTATIERAQDLITDGETYEVCLTTTLETSWPEAPWKTYRRLRRDNPTPFGAYLTSPDVSVLSTSPERFVRIFAAGRVESKPIKGTRPRGVSLKEDDSLKQDLAASEKDRAENLMIVDLVRHDLGRTAELGSVRVDRLFGIETYATVHQLVSTVSAQLSSTSSPVDCIRAAFPPGSMTGAPKLRTMSIIDDLETGPRGVYSGVIGYFSLNGAVDLSVLIRTAVLSHGHLTYGVGGAIVALSDPDDEYDETLVKARPLQRLAVHDGKVARTTKYDYPLKQ